MYAENFDLLNVITPIRADVLNSYLLQTGYQDDLRIELIQGFTSGFDLGYRGPAKRCDTSDNLPLKVGTNVELWNKVIKEVQLKRFAGPYLQPPFKYYVQSPIGLVPKANGTATRMIVHLSYNFGLQKDKWSINAHTPDDLCSVQYNDLDYAVSCCLDLLRHFPQVAHSGIYFSKTDQSSAFRVLPLSRVFWKFLLIKAKNPLTGQYMFFVNKAVPFGSSRSCALYQKFSDALKFIIEQQMGVKYRVTNYLDDFLFIAESKVKCQSKLQQFLFMCHEINSPISDEKTVQPTQIIVFLGIILDGTQQVLALPLEKCQKALFMLKKVIESKRATVLFLQQLTGLFNFMTKAVVPGRTFTRRMYSKYEGTALKQYHHVKLDNEFKSDCQVWRLFLESESPLSYARPFVDINRFVFSTQIQFYTDASLRTGFGCYYDGRWIAQVWDAEFMMRFQPSINYLELYALCVEVFAWADLLRNKRLVIYCDNKGVRDMVNSTVSKSKQAMILLRKLMLVCLQFNFRLSVRYLESSKNILADSLSRQNWGEFWKFAPRHTKKV